MQRGNGRSFLCFGRFADCHCLPDSGLWPATLLIGLAAAGHQAFPQIFYADLRSLPSRAVASVVGIGGMLGAIGGMLIAEIVGHVLEWTGTI